MRRCLIHVVIVGLVLKGMEMSASSPSNPLVASQLLSSAGQSVVQPPTLTLDGAGAIARAGQAR
jgi:hypothetical protein